MQLYCLLLLCAVLRKRQYNRAHTAGGRQSQGKPVQFRRPGRRPKALPGGSKVNRMRPLKEFCRIRTFASKDTRTSHFPKSLPYLAKKKENHSPYTSCANRTPASQPTGVTAAARMHSGQLSRLDAASSHQRAAA